MAEVGFCLNGQPCYSWRESLGRGILHDDFPLTTGEASSYYSSYYSSPCDDEKEGEGEEFRANI